MYQFLYKYLDLFKDENYGQKIESKGHKGTREDPIPIPYIQYQPHVVRFIDEVLDYPKKNGFTELASNERDVVNKESENEVIFNEIIRIVKKEKYFDGAVLAKLKDKTIQNLILILKQREEIVFKVLNYFERYPLATETDFKSCFLEAAGIDLDEDCSQKEANIIFEMFAEELKNLVIKLQYVSSFDGESLPWHKRFYKTYFH